MRPDVETATERVAAVRARLACLPPLDLHVQEIDDALCEGYAQALAGDAWLTRTERRLHELIDDPSLAVAGSELRALAGERGVLERSVIALREELAALRHEHERLGTGSPASS